MMLRHAIVGGFVLSWALMAWGASDCLQITLPAQDSVVPIVNGYLLLEGTSAGPGNQVKGKVFTNPIKTFTGTIAVGRWTAKAIVPSQRTVQITVTSDGCLPKTIHVTGIEPSAFAVQPPLRFELEWSADAVAALKDIARGTLSSVSSEDAFVAAVKQKSLAVARSYLSDVNVEVGVAQPGIKISVAGSNNSGKFGQTFVPPSVGCTEVTPQVFIEIYAGSIRDSIAAKKVLWSILSPSDGESVREDDIAQILGSVIAHEALHVAGLVRCSWMMGDGDWHNNASVAPNGTHRFGNGLHLMDSFSVVLPPALIGRSSNGAAQRDLLAQDAFSRSFVHSLYPRP